MVPPSHSIPRLPSDWVCLWAFHDFARAPGPWLPRPSWRALARNQSWVWFVPAVMLDYNVESPVWARDVCTGICALSAPLAPPLSSLQTTSSPELVFLHGLFFLVGSDLYHLLKTCLIKYMSGCRGLIMMVKALVWQSFDRQFESYLRAFMAAPLWCCLGCHSRIDGRIHRS